MVKYFIEGESLIDICKKVDIPYQSVITYMNKNNTTVLSAYIYCLQMINRGYKFGNIKEECIKAGFGSSQYRRVKYLLYKKNNKKTLKEIIDIVLSEDRAYGKPLTIGKRYKYSNFENGKSLKEICKEEHISYCCIINHKRRNNCSIHEALEFYRKKEKKQQSRRDYCRKLGLGYTAICRVENRIFLKKENFKEALKYIINKYGYKIKEIEDEI